MDNTIKEIYDVDSMVTMGLEYIDKKKEKTIIEKRNELAQEYNLLLNRLDLISEKIKHGKT